MKLGTSLLKILARKYAPSATIDMVFHRYDLTSGPTRTETRSSYSWEKEMTMARSSGTGLPGS